MQSSETLGEQVGVTKGILTFGSATLLLVHAASTPTAYKFLLASERIYSILVNKCI